MKKIWTISGSAILCAVLGVGVLNQYYTGGYEIVAAGKTLGIVTDARQYDTALSQINAQLCVDFGEEAQLAPNVEVKSCFVSKESVTSQQELYENIAAMSDYMVKAATLTADGKKLISFRDTKEAEKTLQDLLKELQPAGSTAHFAETLSVEEEYISVANLYSAEEGAEYLAECGALHILAEKTVTEYAEKPYQTIEQPDDTLVQGTRKVEQAGENGETCVTAHIQYENGIEVSRDILSEESVKEPVDEIVRTGTRNLAEFTGSGTFSMPNAGRISSKFGARWGRTHTGIDIAAKSETPIYAADTGVVSFAGGKGSYGNLVKIDHQNGYETYYAHCCKILVEEGEVVEKGKKIALVGSTGNSTGPHCHFEIRLNGEAQNPLDFVK